MAKKCLDVYQNNGDYLLEINNLKQAYLEVYPDADKSQHRILWRIELINLLNDFNDLDTDIKDLKLYFIGL